MESVCMDCFMNSTLSLFEFSDMAHIVPEVPFMKELKVTMQGNVPDNRLDEFSCFLQKAAAITNFTKPPYFEELCNSAWFRGAVYYIVNIFTYVATNSVPRNFNLVRFEKSVISLYML
ncbi:unnamed protein product [Candida parapsilosis]